MVDDAVEEGITSVLKEGTHRHEWSLYHQPISSCRRRSHVTLRYYERVGLVQPTKRADNNYRVYTEDTLQIIGFIRRGVTGRPQNSQAAIGMSIPPTEDRLLHGVIFFSSLFVSPV